MSTEQILMGFKGFTHPMTQEQVIPTLKAMISNAIEYVDKHPDKPISREEFLGFLRDLLGTTEPATGYFYCPYTPIPTQNSDTPTT